jgi:heme/copper-type cytochrome/quinol oxidase subunit 3
MDTATTSPQLQRGKLSNPVLGTSLFVATEVMFFTALISAFLVIKAGYGVWTPPEGIVLPVGITAMNTVVLLLSGIFLFLSGQKAKVGQDQTAIGLMLTSVILGTIFVSVQGYEWIQLVKHGLTMTSSVFGATFFLLIGSHGLHVLGAVIAMIWLWKSFKDDGVVLEHLAAMQVFWYFVVGVWPLLYGLVYF